MLIAWVENDIFVGPAHYGTKLSKVCGIHGANSKISTGMSSYFPLNLIYRCTKKELQFWFLSHSKWQQSNPMYRCN